MRVYVEGWDTSANEARRLAKSAGIELAARMDGDITHMVVGYGVRMKAAHHEFSVSSGVPLLSPDEFRALVTGDAGETRPLGEIKTGPPEAEPVARSRHWTGPREHRGHGPAFDHGMWVFPLFTCGIATPFMFAYRGAKTGSWWTALWGVLYGFLVGFGVMAIGAGEPMAIYGTAAFAVSTLAGTFHVAMAFRTPRNS
ncbi:hypothetical protein [Phytomonospora endophytica]|uniref:BRCT domain-containing protein n=1 Tax=Phytomonospora endophytica TaxID=714109 RepID=A0A841G7A4_9ACTN|nr:hypothetical protein [Phytomonospora endophytica]MBB6039950.1 hypothetical protein [Phytomonospora endophytica]GIG70979.1 hypothetical protein Pen01_72740 [Phytomonospora endophytica]